MPGTQPQDIPPDTVPVTIDIACPGCEYNLRGLLGPVVACPECGLRSVVPELAARQWDKPWYKAPGFSRVIMPAGWSWLVFLVLMLVGTTLGQNNFALPAVITSAIVVWVWLMVRASMTFNDRLVSLGLALFSHALVMSYMFGLLIAVNGVFFTIDGVLEASTDDTMFGLIVLFVSIGILWLSRLCERIVARVCIRHHLRRKPTV